MIDSKEMNSKVCWIQGRWKLWHEAFLLEAPWSTLFEPSALNRLLYSSLSSIGSRIQAFLWIHFLAGLCINIAMPDGTGSLISSRRSVLSLRPCQRQDHRLLDSTADFDWLFLLLFDKTLQMVTMRTSYTVPSFLSRWIQTIKTGRKIPII